MNPGFPIHHLLNKCECDQDLKRLSDHTRKSIGLEIKLKTEKLQKLQEEKNHTVQSKIKQLQRELGTLLDQEETKWKQKMKKIWYQLGDRNTKLFHTCATERRKKNLIRRIITEMGDLCNNTEVISETFRNYLTNLLLLIIPPKMIS